MNRVRVFCSYAENDKTYYDELSAHLAALRRSECIETWSQLQITAGEDRKERIAKELEDSDVVLFLISADFIACTSCFDDQMQRALELADLGQVIGISLLIRACDWEAMPFARLLTLPEDGEPIAGRTPPERDKAWADIARHIRWRLGRNVPWGAPPREPSPVKLDVLLTQFLRRWSEWGFNISRIRNWGSRQPGFGPLGEASTEDIHDALERLTATSAVTTFKSKSGTRLYKAVTKP